MTSSDSVFNSHTTTTDTDVNQRARLLTQAHRRLSELPAAILELGSIFARNGYELAMVGGPVRDALLGLPIHDYDFTTSARPDETERLLASWGSAHWDIGRDFGTIGASKDGYVVEVTTYRTEEYDADSRKPGVHYGDTLEGDVTRRDFTVNAMAIRLPSMELADTTGGLDDLIAGVIRTPVTARQSFDDDPLRIMRAARFTAQLGFEVADDVREAMTDMAQRLEIVSVERVQSELHRLIISSHARKGLELLVDTGVADIVLPELAQLRDTVDEHGLHKDVYTHTLTVLDQAIALETDDDGEVPSPDFILRFAALMHDIGKPATRRYESDGTVTFHAHDVVGARMVAKRMKALRFDKATTKAVARLVELHLRFHGYGEQRWSDSAVRRYVADAGAQLERLNRLTRADVTTRNKRKARWLAAGMDDLEERIALLKEQEEIDAIRPDLNGQQIMELLDLKPGPEVGQAYSFLLELRMEEGPLGEEVATERLQAWWQQRNA
ncbi:CCA tRNA nucleotidyltransferase [Arcanobacterium phocisimile]|uniref:CCA tRNA nucleotidyltransferase n=1 Tax=Arcanobacterium phocisimile TaxID=1302235 RepID=A0ABX7IH76_9ACTO|nr:CCA tRNA nucleotidyltransferase [Arcanobacterium phocisimile]QRV02172.1 CCA tRNA nucleotidyltransferase [Arcanobacterium phocisimile]